MIQQSTNRDDILKEIALTSDNDLVISGLRDFNRSQQQLETALKKLMVYVELAHGEEATEIQRKRIIIAADIIIAMRAIGTAIPNRSNLAKSFDGPAKKSHSR